MDVTIMALVPGMFTVFLCVSCYFCFIWDTLPDVNKLTD